MVSDHNFSIKSFWKFIIDREINDVGIKILSRIIKGLNWEISNWCVRSKCELARFGGLDEKLIKCLKMTNKPSFIYSGEAWQKA